jgi:hypothetical protein
MALELFFVSAGTNKRQHHHGWRPTRGRGLQGKLPLLLGEHGCGHEVGGLLMLPTGLGPSPMTLVREASPVCLIAR